MAKVFGPPASMVIPQFDHLAAPNDYELKCQQFEADLREYIAANYKPSKRRGQIVQFQVADGYAQYMVASMRPLVLIHLPLGDGYSFPYVNRLKAEDIERELG